MPRPSRLLCAGKDSDLLRTRCDVLGTSGYNAKAATLSEAEVLVRTEEIDLLIVSAWLSECERGKILAAAGKTPALVLTELTLADELLARVARALPSPRKERPDLVQPSPQG
jgi:hypothetical protein